MWSNVSQTTYESGLNERIPICLGGCFHLYLFVGLVSSFSYVKQKHLVTTHVQAPLLCSLATNWGIVQYIQILLYIVVPIHRIFSFLLHNMTLKHIISMAQQQCLPKYCTIEMYVKFNTSHMKHLSESVS